MRKIWNKIVQWILSIPADKRLHFVAGAFVAAFFALSLGVKVAFIPAFVAALFKELFDLQTTKQWEWWDFVATCLGGLLIQVFVLLGIWWM